MRSEADRGPTSVASQRVPDTAEAPQADKAFVGLSLREAAQALRADVAEALGDGSAEAARAVIDFFDKLDVVRVYTDGPTVYPFETFKQKMYELERVSTVDRIPDDLMEPV